jgi:hypothetical protein
MAFDEGGAWLGTSGAGLMRLEPPAAPTATPPATPVPPEGTPPPGPTPTPAGAGSTDEPRGFVLRAPYAVYLPVARRDNLPVLVTLPVGR